MTPVASERNSKNNISTLYEGNSTIEVITVKNPQNNLEKFHRISKTAYVDLSTGEVKQYSRNEKTPQDATIRLRRSMNTLRRLIDLNFNADSTEKFITLTYSYDNDYSSTAKDFKMFWDRFRKHYQHCGYVKIIEPGKNGRWHIHMLVKSMDGSLSVSKEWLQSSWTQGFSYVKQIPYRNFGTYFVQKRKWEEAMVYPDTFRLYTASQNMKRPLPIVTDFSSVWKYVGNCELVHTSKTVFEADNKQINSITYQLYMKEE